MNAFTKTIVSRLSLALGLLALAAPAAAESGSYGYLRVVEGSATLMQAGTDERSSAEINQPVLAGDRLWVPDRSKVEVVLADHNILRIDGGSEVVLERLAGSPDRDDRATVLRLIEGNVQLVVFEESLGDELPRIETSNSTVYVQNYGVFRVTAEREGWSELVVRRGTAEVVTDRGTVRVRADEQALIEGVDRDARAEVDPAGGFDTLERWGRRMDDEYAAADVDYVDDNLRYASAPLARHGTWVHVDGRPYWRPRVASDWRPYWHGRWIYTPAGLTWLSAEPWGWVPYHYGSWDYRPGYGWLWEPGYRWSPAWVYWYWGPSYVGWCPTGYYTRYYGHRFGGGFRYGVYGWAGGDWGYYDRWNFVRSGYFDGYGDGYRRGYRDGYWDGRRDVQRYAVPIDPSRHGKPLDRGIITTDTRPLKPSTWKNPDEVLRALRPGKGPATDLPDVTSFIARKPDLPDRVARTVAADDNTKPLIDGSPLKPSTLGRRPNRGETAGNTDWNNGSPGKPRVIVGDGGGVSGGRPTVRETEDRAGAKPGQADGGSTKPRVLQPGNGDQPVVRERPSRPAPGTDGGSPRPGREATDSKPGRISDDDAPVVRERPSRPAPSADGGSPRPNRVEIEDRPSAKPSRPSSSDRDDAPVVRERPSRPAPSSDGGSPRPERQEKPRVEEKPAVRPPSSYRSDSGDDRSERYQRPEPRYERPEPYVRPERSEPRSSEPYTRPRSSEPTVRDQGRDQGRSSSSESSRPSYRDRDSSSSRPSSPSVRPSEPPRSRGSESSRPQVRERGSRSRGSGGGNN